MKFINKKTVRGLLFSLGATLLVLLIFRNLPFVQSAEFSFRKELANIKYAREGSKKIGKGAELHSKIIGKSPYINIIKMDNYSFTKYGQMPWKRGTYTIPLNKFSKGQVTVTLSWVNEKFNPGKPQHYLIYRSHMPIRTTQDLSKAVKIRSITGFEPQIFLDVLLSQPGNHYFAITQVDSKGKENRAIKPGYNSSEIPVFIKIKPALRPKVKQWESAYKKQLLKQKKRIAITGTINNSSMVHSSTFRSYLNYPKAIFFDVFFLDRKNKQEYKKLVDSLSKNCNIFVDYFPSQDAQVAYPDLKKRVSAVQRFSFPAPASYKQRGSLYYKSVNLPKPDIVKNVEGAGVAIAILDKDEIVRQWPLVSQFPSKKHPNKFYPSAPLLLAMHHFNVPRKNVEIKLGKYIMLKKAAIRTTDKKSGRVFYTYKDIKIPIDEQGIMQINYIGTPGTFIEFAHTKPKHASFASFPSYRPDALKNKIYMVGLYEQSIQSKDRITDFWTTPMGRMYGVEVMANTLNTIITQKFIYIVDDIWNILLVIMIALILGIILPRCSLLKSGIIAFVFLNAFLVASYLLYESNYVIENSGPTLSIFFIFLSLTIFRTATEEKEKKTIKRQFGKLVNQEVVDELLNNPEKLRLGGERREMTVLFSDIRSFTTISEGMDAEELVMFLNEYLDNMTDIVLDNLGTLDKYVGDEIMAFWGAPLPQPEHAFLACATAVTMMQKLAELNASWPSHKQLNIGIGINTGEMLVGYMGSERRMDYTIIGDCVNLGARLEGANKYYRTNIIISQHTYQQVKERVVVRELDLVRVKGKRHPVQIYELLDIKS